MGGYLFASGILLDGNGKPLQNKPDLGMYFTNEFLG
jgi:hypothetical protein